MTPPPNPPPHALSARDLSRVVAVRGEVRVLLHPLDLTLAPGEILGIMGPSGSGKTTLLRLLVGLDARSSGEVSLGASPVTGAGLPGFRQEVALVPQALAPYTGTPEDLLREALAYRPGGDTAFPSARPTLATHLDALGLGEARGRQPWETLSGGEARRAHLAIAASLAPRHFLLDEPSTGLDATTAQSLARWIVARAGEGRGVLLATHDELLLARCATRILILYDGRVQGEGTPADLIPAALREDLA